MSRTLPMNHTGADITLGHMARRGRLVACLVATLAVLGIGGVSLPVPAASAAPLPTGLTSFVALAPIRLADTRPTSGISGHSRVDAHTVRIQVTGRGGVPVGATAAVLNVTATATAADGFVTVYPSGTSRPEASNLNYDAGTSVPNMVTVKLGATGAVDVYSYASADIIVDVSGAYVPTASAQAAGRFVAALPAARRVLDTRSGGVVNGGTTKRVSVATEVPATATAVVVNLTVTGSIGAGYWTAFPSGGSPPNVSNLNIAGPGQTAAGQAIVKLTPGLRAFDVFAEARGGGHLIVDVAGWFTGTTDTVSSDGLFVPNSPTRALDTRWPYSYGRTFAKWTVEFPLQAGISAQAAAVNLTTTNTRAEGYFTAYPARTSLPNASNLNATRIGQTIANHAIVRVSMSGISVYTSGGGHVLADVAGYYLGTPASTSVQPPVNVVPPPSPLPYSLSVPNAGIDGMYTAEGVSNDIVDQGWAGHWPGTGLAGEDSHMVLFGHRTSAGGPFYNLHLLQPGDEMTITGSDGRVHTYRVARTDLTGKDATSILNAAYSVPGPTLSLVACSKPNLLPTSLQYRIVVTAILIS
jgi:sortase (surface protein transpeptidase)